MHRFHRYHLPSLSFFLFLFLVSGLPAEPVAEPAAKKDNIGHARHRFKHGEALPVATPTPERFRTDRTSEITLPQTVPESAFSFLVFGDRTGGVPEGVSILADAVREANLLGPDFVMNVGDMVEGLRDTESWLDDMREYKSIMNELLCPWYPTPGNHDVCWRHFPKDSPPPRTEHDGEYETHFGPLRYAFEHKNSWFVILAADEGNPETGKKGTFEISQRMSDEQFQWLRSILSHTSKADHVFVFLHHPRWFKGKNYGNDWDRVHRLLVEAGNVKAVFAGHVHQMFYEKKDGIEYFVLSSTGGNQGGKMPQAGGLHEFHRVAVRKGRIDVAAIPVGSLIDPRETTARLRRDLDRHGKQASEVVVRPAADGKGAAGGTFSFSFENTSADPVELTATGTERWDFKPQRRSHPIAPGQRETFEFQIRGRTPPVESDRPRMRLRIHHLTPGGRYEAPEQILAPPEATEKP